MKEPITVSIPIESAPVGTVVQLGSKTPDQRISRSEFNRYLFEYFEQLSSGQTGWGVDFNTWLEMVKGWKHHGLKKYERIISLSEQFDSETDWQPIETAPKDGTSIDLWVVDANISREKRVTGCHWDAEERGFCSCEYYDGKTRRFRVELYYGTPTHWMPIPEPPTP